MSPLKVIASGMASLLLIPVFVLSALAGGSTNAPAAGGSPVAVPTGDLSDLQSAVLTDPGVGLTPAARGDVESGHIDPRVLEILIVLAERFRLGPVGPLITGHAWFVAGTNRVSNHMSGRAVDIIGVNGQQVSPANEAVRALMQEVLSLDPPIRPDELGGPFPFFDPNVRTFTQGHLWHVHIGWDHSAFSGGSQ